MKGKETKKEKKTPKKEGVITKVQSDYQNEKKRKSLPDASIPKQKK